MAISIKKKIFFFFKFYKNLILKILYIYIFQDKKTIIFYLLIQL